jgi:hypothetical protein
MLRWLLGAALLAPVAGCQTNIAPGALSRSSITLPLQQAWYEGNKVYYISTDISDPSMAAASGMNLAHRLTDAIPIYPKPPATKTVLERVYKFPGNEQDAVFASAPRPLGPTSQDEQYSPLWLIYTVKWNTQSTRVLKSEEAILNSEDAGLTEITRTTIVVNCPIVGTDKGDSLRGSRVSLDRR